MAGNNIIVVFNFDKMIINIDSDNWVIDKLGFMGMFDALVPLMPWNFAMDKMMGEIHAQGKTIEDISTVLKSIHIHPRVVSVIKEARALGCELRILSDANMFFIEISPYVDFTNCPHGCRNPCPPSLCKGVILERIQASLWAERLKEKYYLMPGKDFPVWTLICDNTILLVKAKIQEWVDGADLERVLLEVINKIVSREKQVAQLLFRDYKLQTISMYVQENSSRVLSVTQ
ncbi:hypothetical protein ACFE04_027429 [Oxalis oulophora]